jgi:hypothetical protein
MSEDAEAEKKRTMFASKAMILTELFSVKFNDTILHGTLPRVPRILPSDVETTDGGKQARNPITLVPVSGDKSASLVCGWVDVGASKSEMRSYTLVYQAFRKRMGMAPDFKQPEYEAFVDAVRAFFDTQQIETTVLEGSGDQAANTDEVRLRGANAEDGPSPLLALLVGAGAVGVVLAAAYYFLR